jgi:predicted nuclease of predicted toxin-antitoxin system
VSRIRLLLDEDTQILLASSLRSAGHDATHVVEAGMSRAVDPEVLAVATVQGRVVFTHNAKDFVPLSKAYARARRPHAGILLSGQASFAELRQRLLRFLHTHTAEDMLDQTRWLP